MDINVIELVLLAIVTFIFAIDQFSLTEIIYRPIIACSLVQSWVSSWVMFRLVL